MTLKLNKKRFFDILKIGNKKFRIYMYCFGIQTDKIGYGSQTDFHKNKD